MALLTMAMLTMAGEAGSLLLGVLAMAILTMAGEADSVIPRTIVHRLDRGTTGLMVLAKTARAEAHLNAQFKARTGY